jgi:arylamine N-acetyltransferase
VICVNTIVACVLVDVCLGEATPCSRPKTLERDHVANATVFDFYVLEESRDKLIDNQDMWTPVRSRES